MKKLIILPVFFAVIALSAYAADTYEEYLQQQMQQYQSYLSEIDRQFTSFLKTGWIERDGEKPEKLLDKPKPVEIPVAEPDKKPEPVKILPKPAEVKKPKPEPDEEPSVKEPVKKEPVADPPVQKQPVQKEPVVKEPEPPVVKAPEPQPETPAPTYVPHQEAKGLGLSFYGISMDIPYDKKIMLAAAVPLSSDNISKWWENTASSDYKKTLKYMQKKTDELNLGDWGFIVLVERFAAKLLGDVPERKILVWFFLNKAGYDAKLGYSREGVTKVLMPSRQELFGVPFYTFSGVRYYVIDVFGRKEPVESLYTYKGKYPSAEKILNLSHMPYPKLGFSGFSRDLKFSVDGREQNIKTIANKYSIAYLNNFPQADLSVYTGAVKPEWIDQTILPDLKKIISGKSNIDSVNILLNFVQNAFQYKTDDVQFGREKFLFAEETVYYPYSDCEDRSVLFAYLVEKLLGLDVIMLDFPGHIAVAVDLGSESTGTYIAYKNKNYTVTDPTYINATAGMVMPQYKNVSPEVIEPNS